jgi:hypothetical protein
MDPLGHIIGLTFVAAVIFGFGALLAFLHALAMRIRLTVWPQPVLPVLAVAAPALGWAGFGLYLLALMAADPTAANLWPLTLAIVAFFWLIWGLGTSFAAALFRFYLRRM